MNFYDDEYEEFDDKLYTEFDDIVGAAERPLVNEQGNVNDTTESLRDNEHGAAERPLVNVNDTTESLRDNVNGNVHGAAESKVFIPTTVDNLDDWASQSSNLRDKYNSELDTLLKLYEMVANFIKRKERILVGGMAIDYALRLVGSELYKVEKIDYDFISPDYHNDAYELGNEIAKYYDGVSVICAKHISTMRVRYNFMAVADITYAPVSIYNKIKTLNYQGFRIIHPWVQQVDQLRAMRNMLEGAPKEIVLSDRIEKDTKRYRMLANAYSIDKAALKQASTPLSKKTHTVQLSHDKVLYGFAAAVYWLHRFKVKSFDYDIKITSSGSCTIVMPDTAKVAWLVDKFDPSMLNNKQSKLYNPMLDKLHPMCILDDCEYFECYGDLYIVENTNVNGKDVVQGYIDGIYSTMTWLSTKWLFYDDEIAGYIYYTLQKLFIADPRTFVPDFKNIFGTVSLSSAQVIAQKKRENPADANLLLPRNAYPDKGEIVMYEFDLSKSKVLQLDGQLIQSFSTGVKSEAHKDNDKKSEAHKDNDKKGGSDEVKFVSGPLTALKRYHVDIVRLFNILRSSKSTIEDIIDEDPVTAEWVLLLVSDKVVAMCRFFPITEDFINEHKLNDDFKDYYQIATVVVDPEMRRKGYGLQLLNHVLQTNKKFILDTYVKWDRAVNLYKAAGFKIYNAGSDSTNELVVFIR